MAHVVTAEELLDGHSVLDIECLDRIYLNAYVPTLQSSGQVVAFMTQHLGKPIPSPALTEHIGTRFRQAVDSYASANEIPWVRFGKDDRKRATQASLTLVEPADQPSSLLAPRLLAPRRSPWPGCGQLGSVAGRLVS